jgi:hypothetical protein
MAFAIRGNFDPQCGSSSRPTMVTRARKPARHNGCASIATSLIDEHENDVREVRVRATDRFGGLFEWRQSAH